MLPPAESRFDCFRTKFTAQLATSTVPAFNYMVLANDHTAGTAPGRRTPNAMIADNDYALGQIVDLISHSPIWGSSLILVLEDDSQDGADHVDAHRIPALAISPFAKRGAVVHNALRLPVVHPHARAHDRDEAAQPLRRARGAAVRRVRLGGADNNEPYDAIAPNVSLTERNTNATPNSGYSQRLPLDTPDRVPQRYLDQILWQYVHGKDSQPPPPGPNASGEDEEEFEQEGSGPGG